MYINDINIIYYFIVGLLGIVAGQFIDWCNDRLPEYKKVFSREFFTQYMKQGKPKYSLMAITALLFIGILYVNGMTINCLKYLVLTPMLLSAFIIDYRLQIIPNRLTLTMFETGLVFSFIQGIFNVNIGLDMLYGMLAGAGIFLFITLVGGLIAGKEAMGFGDVKLMGALGLFFGLGNIVIISLVSFLLGAIIGVVLIIARKKKTDEYIPFGPFIVLAAMLVMFIPFDIMLVALLKIFTLGMYVG